MKLIILGSRGIPAAHGGFETFAENLSLYLTAKGHDVTVYCQSFETPAVREDEWHGIHRVHLKAPSGPMGTVWFDWAAIRDALKRPGIFLVLGYNTAIFSLLFRLRGRTSLMNMDGMEWKREKWTRLQRLWLRCNEFSGAQISTHLIADHPEIGRHLQSHVPASKISVIAYGADIAKPSALDCPGWQQDRQRIGITSQQYALVVARPEPENSILEIVQAFSRRPRGQQLIVLGHLRPEANPYHRALHEAASPEVLFAGAIYDKQLVSNLRSHASVYIHGHRVGGTNPSLVEAMAAGCAVLAQDNIFTRWVAKEGALYFADVNQLSDLLDHSLHDAPLLERLRAFNRTRHAEHFTQETILGAYAELLQRFHAADAVAPAINLPAQPASAEYVPRIY